MSDTTLGDLVHPRHCTVSVSPDRSQMALSFEFNDEPPLLVVLPVEGVVGFQRRLAESLLLIGAQSIPVPAMAATSPQSPPN